MNTLYDFVILLSGNSYTCCVEKDAIKGVELALVEALNHPEKTVCLKDGNRSAQLRPGAIMGWYYKPHEKSTQEKMLETFKNAVEPPEDNWKTGE
jgi:hypothetical protein